MRVTLAKHAGFCFGVKRALDLVTAARRQASGPICTLGPLIHNPQAVARLEEQGIHPIHSLDQVASGATLVIPSHGAAPELLAQAQQRGLHTLDATCPFVANAQDHTRRLAAEGYQVVILGDAGHPEVLGLLGQAGGKAHVVAEPAQAAALKLGGKVGLVTQTTQTGSRLQQVADALLQGAVELRIFNTICAATSQRQAGALELAAQADMMVVVGGRNSANTARLAELCSQVVPTYHVETAAELEAAWFAGVRHAGIAAGASTPDWIIEAVAAAATRLAGGKT